LKNFRSTIESYIGQTNSTKLNIAKENRGKLLWFRRGTRGTLTHASEETADCPKPLFLWPQCHVVQNVTSITRRKNGGWSDHLASPVHVLSQMTYQKDVITELTQGSSFKEDL
jgi:hypothetical protein